MVCSRWPEPRKTKKQNCRPHVHRVKQEPQWGLQFCFLCFFVFRGFCMVCSRWPEPRKTKKQNCRPHVHRVRQEPQWGLQFCFFVFSRFLHGLLQMARTSKKQKKYKKNCRPHVHRVRQVGSAVLFCAFGFSRFLPGLLQMARTSKKKKLQTTCPQSQTRAPMGSAVLFFLFFVFRGFCMVCSRWPEPRKKKHKTADHMSTESDKSLYNPATPKKKRNPKCNYIMSPPGLNYIIEGGVILINQQHQQRGCTACDVGRADQIPAHPS